MLLITLGSGLINIEALEAVAFIPVFRHITFMTKARIYQPDKNAMQSGKAKNAWLLEFAPEKPYFVENLMGWTGMSDMPQEIRLTFATAEAAEAYAKRHNIPYDIYNPNPRRMVKKAYADNFRFGKPSG